MAGASTGATSDVLKSTAPDAPSSATTLPKGRTSARGAPAGKRPLALLARTSTAAVTLASQAFHWAQAWTPKTTDAVSLANLRT